MPNITQKQISDNYLSYLQGQNSNINASAPFSYWSIIAGAEGSVFLDLYANLDIVSKAIYIQNLQGSQIDNKLYESGLSPRGALTVSVISVVFNTTNVPVGTTITIPANTQFQSSNGIVYTLYQVAYYTQPTTTPVYGTPVTLYAIVGGNTTFVGTNSNLTTTIPIGTPLVPTPVTAIVYTSIAGQNQESDQSCVNRLLLQKRSPNCGARIGDYYIYAREASTAVTDVITFPAYTSIDGINSLGVFPLIGSFITEYQLNLGLLSIVYPPSPLSPTQPTAFTQYNRLIDVATFNIVKPYILSSQLLGIQVTVGGCTTYPLESSLNNNPILVKVSLPPIYSNLASPLDSLIQIPSLDVNNNVIIISISIRDLIKREVRRVICNQPYGATNLDLPTPNVNIYNFITLNDIIDGLNYQLSYNNGQIAKLLLDVQITIIDPPYINIRVPKQQINQISNPDGIYEGIYDVSTYATISIVGT